MSKNILITGGAGFIGVNYALRCINHGDQVTILDNLSRAGGISNLKWLEKSSSGKDFSFLDEDVRDLEAIQQAVKEKDVIVHLAAQVAVTTSVEQPRMDFEVNAGGTFNLLEAVRGNGERPIILFASTNKVYGGMDDIEVIEKTNRFDFKNYPFGISEERNLDFHSPYGCSKGCGDQYVHDYSRIYEIPTVVFRQSCIYGPRQFGIEDQGWVAWFIIAALFQKQMKIYGNGKQVRDILYIDDLLQAYDLAIENISHVRGMVFNIGGGNEFSLSIWREFSTLLEKIHGQSIPVTYEAWRTGDQKVYISDIRKAQRELGWRPIVNMEQGISTLYHWVEDNKELFKV